MILELDFQQKFGNRYYYPINDKAKLIADLLGRKTLSEDILTKLRQIGFEFKIVSPLPSELL